MSLVAITGASRSGSTFLGDLMRRTANVCAFHEHIGGRDFFCISAYAPEHPFILHEIRTGRRRHARPGGQWKARSSVDVNSNLGFATQRASVRSEPGVKLFHLARSGRDVVASNWLRKMYSDWAKGVDIRPETEAELDAWERFDRFDKLCWQWNRIASELIGKQVPTVRLEQAVEDYDYLAERLLVTGAAGHRAFEDDLGGSGAAAALTVRASSCGTCCGGGPPTSPGPPSARRDSSSCAANPCRTWVTASVAAYT